MLAEKTIYYIECEECGERTCEYGTEDRALRWATENGWDAENGLCPECRRQLPVCGQCGRKRGERWSNHRTGYVRRADDGNPFDDWYDRWLVCGDEAWCPDHWHVECDGCHTHESGHADALEYFGWRVEENHVLCPECAKESMKGTINNG